VLDQATLSFWPRPRFIRAPEENPGWRVAVTDEIFAKLARECVSEGEANSDPEDHPVVGAAELHERGFSVLTLPEVIALIEAEPESASVAELVSALQRLFFVREPYDTKSPSASDSDSDTD